MERASLYYVKVWVRGRVCCNVFSVAIPTNVHDETGCNDKSSMK